MTKYVLVENHEGELFCTGIFNSLIEAVGQAYIRISEFSHNYEDVGDEFRLSSITHEDNGSGYRVDVEFKSHNWRKSIEHFYHILTFDTNDIEVDI